MSARIKIEGQREKVNVYVDGKPLKGVLSLNYKARPGELPRVFIGMAADDVLRPSIFGRS